ncbi:hypothetical protein ACOBQX_30365 [Actinokineospora sp. G85]|uniref:hypothetical protein n=1 Tax=Actinokineospora sp. G85 TaxID=3406626 RepID=UPI003C76AAA3
MSDQTGQPADPQPTADTATWGAPTPDQRAHPRWSWKKTAAATAVAIGVATAGGFAVYTASGATAEDSRRGGMIRNPASNIMGALHGEFVTPDDNGGYKTMLMQTGEVTAITDTSITTKSTDGYTKTYTINAETVKSTITTGDKVTVLATPSGDQPTADSIADQDTRFLGPGAPNRGDTLPPRRDNPDSGRPGN